MSYPVNSNILRNANSKDNIITWSEFKIEVCKSEYSKTVNPNQLFVFLLKLLGHEMLTSQLKISEKLDKKAIEKLLRNYEKKFYFDKSHNVLTFNNKFNMYANGLIPKELSIIEAAKVVSFDNIIKLLTTTDIKYIII